MRFIDSLCPPALLYLIYTVVHIGLDLSLGRFATAGIKLIMGVSGVVILDALCGVDLGIVSWAIVATPFIMVALASSISLGLGMDHLLHEKFTTPLSGDDLKKNDSVGQQAFKVDGNPLSTSAIY